MKWFSGAPQEDALDFPRELPPIATIPKPVAIRQEPAPALDPIAIMRNITKVMEKYVADQKEQEIRNQQLQVELTEALLAQESFRKKIDFLELENIELRNNLQISEAANYDKTKTLEGLRSALDGLGIQKRARNGNKRKEESPCTDPSPSLPLSSQPAVPPPPPSPSTATSAPTPEAIGRTASSTESDAGIVGTA